MLVSFVVVELMSNALGSGMLGQLQTVKTLYILCRGGIFSKGAPSLEGDNDTEYRPFLTVLQSDNDSVWAKVKVERGDEHRDQDYSCWDAAK